MQTLHPENHVWPEERGEAERVVGDVEREQSRKIRDRVDLTECKHVVVAQDETCQGGDGRDVLEGRR
jgi:hypothetical protein